MTIAKADIGLPHECFIAAMLLKVNLPGNFFEAFLRYVRFLERVLGWKIILNISEPTLVILSPVLLGLLKKCTRLNLWVFFLRMLQTPPLLALSITSKMRQLTSMNTNSHGAEF